MFKKQLVTFLLLMHNINYSSENSRPHSSCFDDSLSTSEDPFVWTNSSDLSRTVQEEVGRVINPMFLELSQKIEHLEQNQLAMFIASQKSQLRRSVTDAQSYLAIMGQLEKLNSAVDTQQTNTDEVGKPASQSSSERSKKRERRDTSPLSPRKKPKQQVTQELCYNLNINLSTEQNILTHLINAHDAFKKIDPTNIATHGHVQVAHILHASISKNKEVLDEKLNALLTQIELGLKNKLELIEQHEKAHQEGTSSLSEKSEGSSE